VRRAILIPLLLLVGCIDVKPAARDVASPALNKTEQAPNQPASAYTGAHDVGGDKRDVTAQVPITASGSGWPLALVVLGAIVAFVIIKKVRKARRLRRLKNAKLLT
jgi:hypothetical protein